VSHEKGFVVVGTGVVVNPVVDELVDVVVDNIVVFVGANVVVDVVVEAEVDPVVEAVVVIGRVVLVVGANVVVEVIGVVEVVVANVVVVVVGLLMQIQNVEFRVCWAVQLAESPFNITEYDAHDVTFVSITERLKVPGYKNVLLCVDIALLHW